MLVELTLIACVMAQQQLLLSPGPTDLGLYIDPVVYNGTLLGPAGSSEASHWYITQWSATQSLPTNATFGLQGNCSLGVPVWYVESTNARICRYDGTTVELHQTGAGTGLQCGEEQDVFLSPVDPFSYASYPTNQIPSQPLANLTSLTLSFSATLNQSSLELRCGPKFSCGPSGDLDYGYAVAALVFNNFHAQQNLFYQIMLWDTRALPGFECGVNPCTQQPQSWFFPDGPSFGVNDNIVAYDVPCLRPSSQSQNYSLNTLPFVTHAILTGSSPSSGIDSNLSNWQLTSSYIGLGLQGSATQTLILANIDITSTSL